MCSHNCDDKMMVKLLDDASYAEGMPILEIGHQSKMSPISSVVVPTISCPCKSVEYPC